MSTLLGFLVVIALFAGAGLAVTLGFAADTRDPDWSLGRFTQPHG